MTRTIVCQQCGIEGEIEVEGFSGDTSSAHLFRHLGHNPVSGHLHYQCPACEIVLLVDPLTVWEALISGHPRVIGEPEAQSAAG